MFWARPAHVTVKAMVAFSTRRRRIAGAVAALASAAAAIAACDSFTSTDSPGPGDAATQEASPPAPAPDASVSDGAGPDVTTKPRFCQTQDGGASDGGFFTCEDFDGVTSPDAGWDPWTPFTGGEAEVTRGPFLTSEPFALAARLAVTDAGPASAGLRLPFPFAYGTMTISFDLRVLTLDSDAGVPPVVSLLRVYEIQSGSKFLTELKVRRAGAELRFELLVPTGSFDVTPVVAPVVGATKRLDLKFEMSSVQTSFTLTVGGTASSGTRVFANFPGGVTEAAIDLGARTSDPRAVVEVRYDSIVIQR